MRPNTRRILIALGLGLLAALFLVNYLRQVERRAIMKGTPEDVLVARKDIPPKSVISEDLVELREIPRPFIEPNALRTLGEAMGMVAMTRIPAGTQITSNLIIPPTIWTVLSSFVPEEYRAVTIDVDEVKGVGGLILPGDEVDVVATFGSSTTYGGPKLGSGSFSTVAYKRLRVLAVGKNLLALPPTMTEQERKPFEITPEEIRTPRVSSVTLAVPEDRVKEFVFLDQVAYIRLILRSVHEIGLTEEEETKESPLTYSQLLARFRPRPRYRAVKKARPIPEKIDVYYRTEKYSIKPGQAIPYEVKRTPEYIPGSIPGTSPISPEMLESIQKMATEMGMMK